MSGVFEIIEEFGNCFVVVIDSVGLVILVSVGYQIGLLDIMVGFLLVISMEIVEVVGLEECYVWEWLGGMIIGQIVEYDVGSLIYLLFVYCVGMLICVVGLDNFVVIVQFVLLFGEVE